MEHLPATFDLRQMTWGGRWDPAWEGAWERLAVRARAWTGPTVVISNELLGGVTEQQACQAVASLRPRCTWCSPHGTWPASYPRTGKNTSKHRHTVTLTRFIDELIEHGIDAPEPFGDMFWGLHDPARVLGSWRAALPPQRLHLITVPQPGGPGGLLWQRFATLCGLDSTRLDTDIPKANTSIGQTEAEFLRRLNLVLGHHRLGRDYPPLVRADLAENILASRADQTQLRLPCRYHAWVTQRSKQLVTDIRAAGYDVIGDLDELLPPSPSGDDPDTTAAPEVLDVALDSLAQMLERMGPTQRRLTELEDELARRRRQPFKTLARDASEKHPTLMRLRVHWWHLVGRLRRLRRPFLIPARRQ